MVTRFSGRCCTVVAAGTAGGHTGMIKNRPREGICIVAIITDVAAGDVVGRFARGRDAVVATGTCSQHGGVINPGDSGEIAGVMAILACV